MSSIGYRQKGDNGPLYNPERDYAYITPTLMTRAIENMDIGALSAEALDWYAKNNITDDDVTKIAEALAAAQRDFVNAADPVSSFEQALARRNFMEFSYPLRQLLFAAVGEVCCAAWFLAVREVSIIGEESPAQANMARFVSTVREFAARHGAPKYDADFAADHLLMRNDVLQTRMNLLYKELDATREKLAAMKLAAMPPSETTDTAVQVKPLWQRIKTVFMPSC
jgi:hypothetical protein